MGFKTLDIEFYGFPGICQGLLSSSPLRNAPWQCGNLCHENTVFILLNEYPEFEIAHFGGLSERFFVQFIHFNSRKIAIIQNRRNQYWRSSSPAAGSRSESISAYHLPRCSDFSEDHVDISEFPDQLLIGFQRFEILPEYCSDFEIA